MKLKKYLTVEVGMIAVLVLLLVSIFYVSQNSNNSANQNESNNTSISNEQSTMEVDSTQNNKDTSTNTQSNPYIG